MLPSFNVCKTPPYHLGIAILLDMKTEE